jgi:hypothetical protein
MCYSVSRRQTQPDSASEAIHILFISHANEARCKSVQALKTRKSSQKNMHTSLLCPPLYADCAGCLATSALNLGSCGMLMPRSG